MDEWVEAAVLVVGVEASLSLSLSALYFSLVTVLSFPFLSFLASACLSARTLTDTGSPQPQYPKV